jgi:hypothetical protein
MIESRGVTTGVFALAALPSPRLNIRLGRAGEPRVMRGGDARRGVTWFGLNIGVRLNIRIGEPGKLTTPPAIGEGEAGKLTTPPAFGEGMVRPGPPNSPMVSGEAT